MSLERPRVQMLSHSVGDHPPHCLWIKWSSGHWGGLWGRQGRSGSLRGSHHALLGWGRRRIGQLKLRARHRVDRSHELSTCRGDDLGERSPGDEGEQLLVCAKHQTVGGSERDSDQWGPFSAQHHH